MIGEMAISRRQFAGVTVAATARLAAQPRDAVARVKDGLLDRAQLRLHARARDADLARLVDQLVEDVGVDAKHRRRAG